MERGVNQKLPFLDTLIHRGNQGVLFSVYRKPTNKDDFIHYFSAHSHKVKTGTAIGFYLRAYRICSVDFLEDEVNYITNAFMRLAYPESLLLRLKDKAKEIRNRQPRNKEEKGRNLILPSSKGLDIVERMLGRCGITVASPTGTTVRDLVRLKSTKRSQAEERRGSIYRIPCSTCSSTYIGETGRGLRIRLREHQRDFTTDNASNALVQHTRKSGHLPDWPSAQTVRTSTDRTQRRALEAAYIQPRSNALNTSPGFFVWATAAAKLALNHLAT